jgi:hypothetical protein
MADLPERMYNRSQQTSKQTPKNWLEDGSVVPSGTYLRSFASQFPLPIAGDCSSVDARSASQLSPVISPLRAPPPLFACSFLHFFPIFSLCVCVYCFSINENLMQPETQKNTTQKIGGRKDGRGKTRRVFLCFWLYQIFVF